ncbi:histidine kinase [Massilia sp. PAMC28688]|uniref:sensor histidine kinase n=1 Tax=Massilia sp. PAMC28688 TaxID=2861283 RepID=UPI001C63909E|nr:histidine kinase [Massilia sp. PAMC28688]QYF92418.1 histidine kinase [Massilia sp. PAMC28688]
MPVRRPAAILATGWLLFWMLMVAVAVQDYARDDGTAYWQPVLWETSSFVAVTLLLLVQHHFTRGDEHLVARPARWFARQARWLPLYWVAFVPLAFGIRHGVYALAGQVYEHEGWGETFLYESLKLTVFIILFCLVRFGWLSYSGLLEEKVRVERANALLRQAQLQRLAQQMQPHFLFNALNTISSLMHSDVERADATLIQLAEVLRTTLEVSDVHAAPLATELRLAQGYARVMQERYAGRVAISWDIDDAALTCSVPVMSIQPLLENIFKHTVETRRGLTTISIGCRREHGTLVVSLLDDAGRLAPASAPGIGLANLRERLAVLFGDAAAVTLTEREPAGVCAEMRVPCAS